MLHQYSDNLLLSVSFSGYYPKEFTPIWVTRETTPDLRRSQCRVSLRSLRDCFVRGTFLVAASPREAGGKFGGQFNFHPFFPTRPCQITLCDCFVKANIFSLAITRLRCLLRCRTDRVLHRDNKVS